MTKLEQNRELVRQAAIEYIKNNKACKKDYLHRSMRVFSHQTRWHHLSFILKERGWKPGQVITIELLSKEVKGE